MRQEKHIMDNHAKWNLRGLVASAIFAAVLGLGSGKANATLFLVDFDPAPGGGFPTTSFTDTADTGDVFRFEISGGGDFTIASSGQGDGGSDGIFATSNPEDDDDEFVTIELNAGGFFFFDSIFIDSLGPDMFLEGRSGTTTLYSTTVDGTMDGTQPSGNSAVLVDAVRLRSADFNSLIFDTFRGHFEMDMQPMPEPGTLALFLTGLIGLGLLSRRRRRSA